MNEDQEIRTTLRQAVGLMVQGAALDNNEKYDAGYAVLTRVPSALPHWVALITGMLARVCLDLAERRDEPMGAVVVGVIEWGTTQTEEDRFEEFLAKAAAEEANR